MNTFTFSAGTAHRLKNGTCAVLDGTARIAADKEADFRVELSSSDEHRHCSGLCTVKLNDLLTMSAEDFLIVSAVEQEITLAAITAYRDWLDGVDSVLDVVLAFVGRESFSPSADGSAPSSLALHPGIPGFSTSTF